MLPEPPVVPKDDADKAHDRSAESNVLTTTEPGVTTQAISSTDAASLTVESTTVRIEGRVASNIPDKDQVVPFPQVEDGPQITAATPEDFVLRATSAHETNIPRAGATDVQDQGKHILASLIYHNPPLLLLLC